MGLDTYADLKNDEEVIAFGNLCEEYMAKNHLEPSDVDVAKYDFQGHYWEIRKGYSWDSCHSRILLGDLEKVYFGEEAHPFMHPITKLLDGWPLVINDVSRPYGGRD